MDIVNFISISEVMCNIIFWARSGAQGVLGTILTRASQVLPLRILDLEIFYQNPLRTSRDDPWDH